jgi:glycosyltransferase involved in cell wall biosynthesis
MVDVSVVIPTWNNAERLGITLDAVAACHVPDRLRWELIVVANNCTDRTRDAAAPFSARLPLTYLEESSQGSSNARNRGVAEARGALILFADDDVRPCRDWIALYWSTYQATGDHHYFGGPLRSEFENGFRPDRELLRVANRSVAGFDYGPLGPGEEFLEANWACPAAALRVVGG